MYTLKGLQDAGVLLSTIRKVDTTGTIALSNALSMNEKEFEDLGAAVVVDGAMWVGTVNGVPVNKAVNVYSSDGNTVGRWNSSKSQYIRMEMQDSGVSDQLSLVTKKIINFKRRKEMAELKVDTDVLMAELNEAAGAATATEKAKGFDDVDDGKPAKEKSEAAKERERKNEEFNQVRKKLESAYTGSIKLPEDVTYFNRAHGRLIAFITPTDSVVKVSLAARYKTDANGNKILKPSVNDEKIIQMHKEKKRVAAENYLQEREFVFKDTKPSSAKGVIVRTPAGTDMPLTAIGSTAPVKYEKTENDYRVKVMDMNMAWLYIDFNYGGAIKEDEAILGEAAAELVVHHSISTDKNGAHKARNVMKPKDGARKSLLVPGNYVPLKVYDTISTQAITDQGDKDALNLNFEAAIKRATDKDKNGIAISKAATDSYKVDAAGSVHAKWVDEGEPIHVATFYDKNAEVKNVRLPRRSKEKTKDGSKDTYKYVFFDMDDAEHGPLSLPEVKAIINRCGFEVEQFKKIVSTAATTKRGGAKQKANVITYEQYLRGNLGHDAVVVADNRSLSDLQEQLDSLGNL